MEEVKFGAIDLGTNTFHLVVFEKKGDKIQEIFRKRHHVFLSEKGIKTIAKSSIERARLAIQDFKIVIEQLAPSLRIIGTEALRKASNGQELRTWIENELSCEVEIISGEREAELIAKGVRWEWNRKIDDALIMDIGGGSVEFIQVRNDEIEWKQSFPVGVGVLHHFAQHTEPISPTDKNKLRHYLDSNCKDLIEHLRMNPIKEFIGSSGSFELIPSIIQERYPPTLNQTVISKEDFIIVKDRIFQTNLEGRLKIKGLPPVRAELIVVAFVLMEWVLDQLDTSEISISKYAVKEGLIYEMLSNF